MTGGLSLIEFLIEFLKVLTGDNDICTCRMKNGGDKRCCPVSLDCV